MGGIPVEKILSKCEELIVSSFANVYLNLNLSVMKVNYTALVFAISYKNQIVYHESCYLRQGRETLSEKLKNYNPTESFTYSIIA